MLLNIRTEQERQIMKIRMKRDVAGTFHGIDGGVKVGDVVDVDNDNGVRYCKLGYAEPVGDKNIDVETAVPVYEERKADDIPEDVSVTTAAAVGDNVGVPVLTNDAGAPAEVDAEAPHKAPVKHAPAKAAPKKA